MADCDIKPSVYKWNELKCEPLSRLLRGRYKKPFNEYYQTLFGLVVNYIVLHNVFQMQNPQLSKIIIIRYGVIKSVAPKLFIIPHSVNEGMCC